MTVTRTFWQLDRGDPRRRVLRARHQAAVRGDRAQGLLDGLLRIPVGRARHPGTGARGRAVPRLRAAHGRTARCPTRGRWRPATTSWPPGTTSPATRSRPASPTPTWSAWRRSSRRSGRPSTSPANHWRPPTPRCRNRTTPLGRLWHAATILREYRGDCHVALLTSAGLDGAAANAFAVADGRAGAEPARACAAGPRTSGPRPIEPSAPPGLDRRAGHHHREWPLGARRRSRTPPIGSARPASTRRRRRARSPSRTRWCPPREPSRRPARCPTRTRPGTQLP